MEILRLLNVVEDSASDREALMVELPALQCFRSEEVTTYRIEYMDAKNGLTRVLDAKKHQIFTIPLIPLIPRHVEGCRDGRSRGLVVRNESSAWRSRRNKPVSIVTVWSAVRKWAKRLRLRPSYRDYSPIVLRRFCAKELLRGDKDEPIESFSEFVDRLLFLQRFMRHKNIENTIVYVQGITFAEDDRQVYESFSRRILRELARAKAERLGEAFPIMKVKT